MQDIKVGDFVWHEEYGKGMCTYSTLHNLSIQFESLLELRYFNPQKSRDTLFKKGDLVIGKRGRINIECYGIFIGWTDEHYRPNLDFLILKEEQQCSFIHNIKHQEQPLEISVNLTVNGKDVSPDTLSEETWNNLRTPK
jgi:hypothetical protein